MRRIELDVLGNYIAIPVEKPGKQSFSKRYLTAFFISILSMIITTDGYSQGMGIGTADPVNILDVEGSVAIGATYSGTSAAPANGMIIEGNVGIGNTAGSEPLHVTADAGHDNIMLGENSGVEFWNLSIDADGDFNFEDEGTVRVTFEDGGEVGIGIEAPEDPLHIISATAKGGNIRIEENSGGQYWRIGVDGDGDLYFFDDEVAEVVIMDGGDVGIGTEAPSHQVEVVDVSTTADRAAVYVDQNAAVAGTGYAAYFTKTGASVANVGGFFEAKGATNNYAIIVPQDGGYVGVGTITPSYLFTLAVDDAQNNKVTDIGSIGHGSTVAAVAGIGTGLVFKIEDNGGSEEEAASIDAVYDDPAAASVDASLLFNVDVDGTSKEVLRIDGTSGYAGINVTVPRADLHATFEDNLNGTATDIIILEHSLSAGAAAAGIGTGLSFYVQDDGGVEEQASIDVLLDDVTEGSEDATMAFNINQNGTITEIMRIDGTEIGGRVGIGETDPSAKVDVVTSTASETAVRLTQTAVTGVNYSIYATVTGAATTNYGAYFSATDATNNYAVVTVSGNVGIAWSTPGDILEIKAQADNHNIRLEENSGGDYWVIGIDTDGDLNFEYDDATIYLTLEDGGQVGVNTETPAAQLDVNGTFAMRIAAKPLVNGDNADVDFSGATFIQITGVTADFAITGIAGGVDGRMIIVYQNEGAYDMTIKHDDAGSSAGNKIYCEGGVDVTHKNQTMTIFIYSATDSHWIHRADIG